MLSEEHRAAIRKLLMEDCAILSCAQIGALNAVLADQQNPSGEFVTVRAAVAVSDDGTRYVIKGGTGMVDEAVRRSFQERYEYRGDVVFITARVPIVKPLEVEGEVENG